MEFITHSPEETERVGQALGQVLKPGTAEVGSRMEFG